MEPQLEYGNWIRKKVLVVLGICVIAAGLLSLLPLGSIYRVFMLLLLAITLVTFLFPFYTYIMVSQHGGKLQDKVYNLIVQSLGDPISGRLLDIGCGNGVLAVKLAQRNADAQVVGIDYWGKNWEYSKEVCDKNARIGGVEQRVQFLKGDAAVLEFDDGAFDAAVSNLTFHEVRSADDKRQVVAEALRVVKKDGRFAFVDYFYDAKVYGPSDDFEQYLRGLGLAHFELTPLGEKMHVPLLLRHPRILGHAALLLGTK